MSASDRLAIELLRRHRARPELFARQALGAPCWSRQVEVLQALAKPNARVAVKSGHKTGKTRLGGVALHWFAHTFRRARAVFTGPTFPNIQNVIWPEVRRLHLDASKGGMPLGGRLFDDLTKGIVLPNGSQIFGITVRDPEAMAGISGENLLFLVDEASGVDQRVYEAIFGNTSGGARVLLLGNPTRVAGVFYDAFHTKRAAWETFTIDSRQTPNFDPALPDIPGLARPEFVEWAKEQWGEGTPQWDVRIAGNFPRLGDKNVVSLGAVEDAKARAEERTEEPVGPLRLGVDVARFGDDASVIAAVRGNTLVTMRPLHGLDVVDVAGKVLELAGQLRDPTEGPPQVNVDVIGVGGGVVDVLARHADQVQVVGVDVGSSPTSQPALGPGYSLLRDQLWFGVAEWLDGGGELTAVPDVAKLEAELVAPEYDFDARGRYKVEPKAKTKERLGRSPDRADALCLAVYEAPTSEMPTGQGKRRKTAKLGGF